MAADRRHLLGAHAIAEGHAYSVARVRGITQAICLATGMGLWILFHQQSLFRTPAWKPLYTLLDGDVWAIGWIILLGGCLGFLGLVTRRRSISIMSCIVCISWFAWLGGFLWYSNFTDAPNIGAFLCLYGLGEYVYRLILLSPIPTGRADVSGW